VLVPRETPYSQIHLENMLRLTQAGAWCCRRRRASTTGRAIDDLIDFVVGRVLSQLGVDHELGPRWRPASGGGRRTVRT
jgi:flavin prenyltransferase